MSCFIPSKDCHHNLDHIATIREVRPNLFQALDEEGKFIAEFSSFHNMIVKVIPIGKEAWECLLIDEGEPDGYYAVPVIAWGLNPEGLFLPILANTREPIDCDEDFGLRKISEETVYMSYGDIFENVDQWLVDAAN